MPPTNTAPHAAGPSAAEIARMLACGRSGCSCTRPGTNGAVTHCVAHADQTPSMAVTERDGKILVHCLAGCPQTSVLEELRRRGLWPSGHNNGTRSAALSPVKRVTPLRPPAGLTVEALATAKKLDLGQLLALGVCNTPRNGNRNAVSRVSIVYRDSAGNEKTVRYRHALSGPGRFSYRRGDKAMLYGLQRLPAIKAAGWVLIVEGESDCWTGWQYDLPIVGVPGKSTWRPEWADCLQDLDVFIWQEPDAEDFTARITRAIPAARVIVAPDGTKDLSEAHIQGIDLPAELERWKTTAIGASELLNQQAAANLHQLHSAAAAVLAHPDPLQLVEQAIANQRYGGDGNIAVLTYLAATSRVLATDQGQMLVHLLLVGPPSAGKSYTVGVILRLLPPKAFHVIDAGSPRVLIYDDADLRHRLVVFGEADSLPAGEDNPAASAIRNLLQDGYLHYKVTVRDPDTGAFTVREVDRPGPSVLITTSTRRLGDQLESRLFRLEVPDDQQQIRSALQAQAQLELHGTAEPDADLIAFQAYLQAAAPWGVIVPFADRLATLIGQSPAASRILRDFSRLLSLIKTVTVLRHVHRQRRPDGRIEATLEDCETVYHLINEVFRGSVTGASARIRDAVAAVMALKAERPSQTISVAAVAERLGINKMACSRRVSGAFKAGFLANQEQRKGLPYALDLGDALPADDGLPKPEELRCNTVTPLTDGSAPPDDDELVF